MRTGRLASYLQWTSPKKKQETSRVELSDVSSIEFGMSHARFSKKKAKIADGEHRCVTITYGSKTLCLIFRTPDLRELFVTALQFFILIRINPDPDS